MYAYVIVWTLEALVHHQFIRFCSQSIFVKLFKTNNFILLNAVYAI